MKGIYLCAYKAHHPNYNLDYNDVIQTSPHVNIIADMSIIDLDPYDYHEFYYSNNYDKYVLYIQL